MNTWLRARGEVNREFKSPTTPSFPARFFIEHYNRLRALSLNDSRNAAIPTGINDQSHERLTMQHAISSPVWNDSESGLAQIDRAETAHDQPIQVEGGAPSPSATSTRLPAC